MTLFDLVRPHLHLHPAIKLRLNINLRDLEDAHRQAGERFDPKEPLKIWTHVMGAEIVVKDTKTGPWVELVRPRTV